MKNAIILSLLCITISLSRAQSLIPFYDEGNSGKYGYKDSLGKKIVPAQYEEASDFSDGMAAVKKNGNWGYINAKGRIVIPLQFYEARPFSEGLAAIGATAAVRVDKPGGKIIKYTYINPKGKKIITPFETPVWYTYISEENDTQMVRFTGFDRAQQFAEGLAAVELNGKWGFIDQTGKQIIPFQYDFANLFYNGKAEVELNGRTFYVDKNGNELK